ncbi:hypothetical protein [Candidatus Cetobacterium colombiensis]|uniref:Uncharacterized protein n=1 Tax=Candidatus Cetobacterium colombiensis TaxID=3073100 RepID=A0ABU4WBJ3_9FUSO|nr:hypothetical protein [Candidatus Cetobacterium colombiensis]MDX8335931.1 hypothetical protein [Candidatus Cetobacterium colombiensis]
MSSKFLSIEDLLISNSANFKKCKNKLDQIKQIEKILKQNYSPLFSKYYITKIFKIKKYKYEPSISSGKIPALKIGSRIFIKTTYLAPFILSEYKNIIEVKNDKI